MEPKAARILEFAERRFAEGADWVAFFREVLGITGIVRQAFDDVDELSEFERSAEYAKIQELLVRLRPNPTRVMTLRLPQSLHEALRAEAHESRTSFNKLCISKLAQPIEAALAPMIAVGAEAIGDNPNLGDVGAANSSGSARRASRPIKELAAAEAQYELPKLLSSPEPLVLTEGSKPVAVLVHIEDLSVQTGPDDRQISVVRLKDLLSDKGLLATVGDDAVCVVSTSRIEGAPVDSTRNWWEALGRIEADQRKRGFVGTVAEIDRGDQGYDERMEEIYKHTLPKNKPG